MFKFLGNLVDGIFGNTNRVPDEMPEDMKDEFLDYGNGDIGIKGANYVVTRSGDIVSKEDFFGDK
jgi:L-lactate utilization protein LutB